MYRQVICKEHNQLVENFQPKGFHKRVTSCKKCFEENSIMQGARDHDCTGCVREKESRESIGCKACHRNYGGGPDNYATG